MSKWAIDLNLEDKQPTSMELFDIERGEIFEGTLVKVRGGYVLGAGLFFRTANGQYGVNIYATELTTMVTYAFGVGEKIQVKDYKKVGRLQATEIS